MAFANHLSKASPDVVQFGTTTSKYLYVEGKSDKNIMARLVMARPNNVIIKNISDDQIPDEHTIPDMDRVKEAKLKVTRICHRKRVHGLVDRDGDDPSKFPPRCLTTDFRDLESTMFHYGGHNYVRDLLSALTSPVTKFPDLLLEAYNRRFEKLSSTVNSYFFPNGRAWTEYNSVCRYLDRSREFSVSIGSSDNQILDAIATAYHRPMNPSSVPCTSVGEINGHLLVSVFVLLLKLDGDLRQHLHSDQMDIQFLNQSLEVLKLRTENAMQLSVTPPLKAAIMTTRIASELNLTTFPEWW